MTNKMQAEFKLISPEAKILNNPLPEFKDEILPEGFTRTKIAEDLFVAMKQFGGIGLSANQVGLPYRMFVMGGHPQIDLGRTRYCFNPEVLDMSKEMVMMKEGCLSFPFIFVAIKRPKWIEVQYEDEDGKVQKQHLHGMNSRIYQHENEHMNGLIFKDLVSDFKWKRAEAQAKKTIEKLLKKQTKH